MAREVLLHSGLNFEMFKLTPKTPSFFSSHENLRLLSGSSAFPITDFASAIPFVRQNPSDSETQKEGPSKSAFPPLFGSKFHVSRLQDCRNISQVKNAHALIVKTGMLQIPFVANKLLYLYCQFKAISPAFAVFSRIGVKDPFTWSVMVGGFAKTGDFEGCLGTFRDLVRSGFRPDNYTLPSVIRACRDRKDVHTGRLVHHVVIKFGLAADLFISASLVGMYAKCKEIEEARRVFDKMPERDPVTWTVMISAYGEEGDARESLALFDQMRDEGVDPDNTTMVTVVNACAKLGAMNKAKYIHSYIDRKKFAINVILATAMIDMYSKCGSVETAREIFNKTKGKNVITWSAMIAAYGHHGLGQKALDLFPAMLNASISPNKITFVSLLYACSHSGLVDEGLRLFSSMQKDYSMRPDVKHYTCMVDLLGRAGRLKEAVELIEGMEVAKDEGLWSAFLGASRIKGNSVLVEKAAKSLLELQPGNAGHYVLLSNIYAKAQQWKDVAKVRGSMTHRRLKKVPGWTWIEVEDGVHQFSVGDGTHPRSKEIYEGLERLRGELEEAGFVPDTEFVVQDVEEEVKQEMLYSHSEKLAIAFGLIATPEGSTIRITKNLRICGDCHTFSKMVSRIERRMIVARDANRFHHFGDGVCSCGDYW